MITLETARCRQGCKILTILLNFGGSWGYRIRGCGGPYRDADEIPTSAIRSLRGAHEAGLKIDSAVQLAHIQRDIEATVARFSADGRIDRSEAEAFLAEVFL